MNPNIVVRFAPSPTGYLHVGGARTAIFNWLYARNVGGRFLLRIEDTDKNRSSEEMVREILDGLRWLGVDWDNSTWIQSEHEEQHRAACDRLLQEGKAYWCYCASADLAEKRRIAEEEGVDSRYDRTCLHLTPSERAVKDAAGVPKAMRFLIPEGETTFYDIVHESTTFQHGEIEDFVILRSDGTPVYMIAVVVDDHAMEVTHVLRGDDHLPNTPKQILLYQALGFEVPVFGHLPLILGADKKRLSKRHGATSVGEYQARGFLPEALFNFLALLGWSPGDDREVMKPGELVEAFDVTRILKKSSVFDEDKLRWMNGKHIRELPDDVVLERLRPYVPAEFRAVGDERLLEVLPLMKERMFFLPDLFEQGSYFFRDPEAYDPTSTAKHWNSGTSAMLRSLIPELSALAWDEFSLETFLRAKAEELGISAGKLIHPLRLALTGGSSSPGMFAMMMTLGRETVLRRIESACERLLN
jgi:glutamyl-tRNA synthetase